MNERKGFLLLVIIVLGYLSAQMLMPFLAYVLGAVILAFITYPVKQRLSPYMGEKASSLFVVLLSIFITIIPVFFIGGAVTDDAQDLLSELETIETVDVTSIEQKIQELTGQDIQLEERVKDAVRQFVSVTVGSFSQILGIVTNLTIGISLMLFLMYYFVKDGKEFIEWLKEIIPLDREIQENLFARMNRTTWAVVKGHVLVAIAQGVVAGVGIFIAGVSNYFFWTFVMVILAFLPLIGSILVWGPAGVYMIATGDVGPGLFLLAYGSIVVGLTDNFLRPLLVDRGTGLHPATIIIGVMGGVFVFGAPGLFIGPITLGIFKSTLLVFKNNYEDL
ncbi:MAG: AI-2E family transporter [Candidatus Nanohaloarchaea archaeon]